MTFVAQAAQSWLEEHEYFSLLKQGRKWEGLGCSGPGRIGGPLRSGEGSPRAVEAVTRERGGGR